MAHWFGRDARLVKLLCAPHSGELLGAQILGPEAGELIHELISVMYYPRHGARPSPYAELPPHLGRDYDISG